MAASRYDASAIEVLTGLEPVRKRPGMYTQTERPNHLAQEVIDNSVDEAIAGHCKKIEVKLFKDGSCSVADDGRGMPIDIHKGEKVSGVEVIMTRLHAGGKFSNKNYNFSGGLHGVGISVVNALSKNLEVWVRRGGKEHHMKFADGQKRSKLKPIGKVGAKNTGTTIQFWPDEQFFDSVEFDLAALKRSLRAKAVLCAGLEISLIDEAKKANNESWLFEDGLQDYLVTQIGNEELVPDAPFMGKKASDEEGEVEWALCGCPKAASRWAKATSI